MRNDRLDNVGLGLATGLLLPVLLGFLIALFLIFEFPQYTTHHFFENIIKESGDFQSALVTLSLLINLAPFFLFLRYNREKAARGVLLAMFLYAPFIVYLKFF